MPDFDTRKPPQEPDRPSRLHLFVAASRRHVSAVASRLGISARALLRSRNRIRRRGKAFVILFVVVLGTGIISWAVVTLVQSGQLNHELRLKRPPNYTFNIGAVDSYAHSCEKGIDLCLVVYLTHGDYDARELASITRSILSFGDYSGETTATSMQFAEGGSMKSTGMSYCFAREDRLIRTLGTMSLIRAQLLGEIGYSAPFGENHCYIVVYEKREAPGLLRRTRSHEAPRPQHKNTFGI